jgi:hypothetical protein
MHSEDWKAAGAKVVDFYTANKLACLIGLAVFAALIVGYCAGRP